MSKYTFTFKKGDIFVDFSTTDRDIVERQFQVWVMAADSYARTHSRTEVKPKIAQEEIANQEKKTSDSVKTEKKEEQPVETFDKASTLLKTINSIQGNTPAQVQEEGKPALMETAPIEQVEEKPVQTVEIPNFENVLEQSIENPTFEPNKNQDQIFLNLIKSKNTTDKFHYLMITAYYLSEFEKKERFTLKQINAKLMQNLQEVIDHSTLQEAINQSFIELVPDLTGSSEFGEYRITIAGEEFFANRI